MSDIPPTSYRDPFSTKSTQMKLTIPSVAMAQQHVKGVLGHPHDLSLTENIVYVYILTFGIY